MNKKYIKIDLSLEYTGFAGEEVIVISDLSRDELLKEYSELRSCHFQLLNFFAWKEICEVILVYNRNEDKHRKRAERKGDAYGYRDGETELFMKSIDKHAVEDKVFNNIDNDLLMKAISMLTDIQRSRFVKYMILGYSQREIAELEGVSYKQVRKSIEQAKIKIKKYFKINN